MTNPLPRKIHYCWFGGKPLTPLAEACLSSWREHCSSLEIVRWDESNIPIADHAYMRLAYEKGMWAFVADYARFLVLVEHGGIYFDTDMEVVKSFDPLMGHSDFVADEKPGRMSAGVIAARPQSAFLKDCLAWMDRDAANGKPAFTPIPNIMQEVYDTGDYELTIFPPEYFYPYNPYDPDQPVKQLLFSDITEQTYAIHHWSASWVRPRTWGQYLKSVAKHAWKSLPNR